MNTNLKIGCLYITNAVIAAHEPQIMRWISMSRKSVLLFLKEDKHEIGTNQITLTFLQGTRIIKHYVSIHNKNWYFEQLS